MTEQTRRSPRQAMVILAVMGLLFVANELWLKYALGGNDRLATLNSHIVLFAGIILFILPIVAIHEGGHLIAGFLLDYRLLFVVVGPILITRQRNGLRVRVARLQMQGRDGVVGMLPKKLDGHMPLRAAIFQAAGPLGNMVSGVIATQWYFANPLWSGLARYSAGLFGAFSLIVGLINLLPIELTGVSSDGLKLKNLAKGDPHREYIKAVLSISHAAFAGVRPRDWDKGVMDIITSKSGEPAFELNKHYLSIFFDADRGETESSQEHFEHAVELRDHFDSVGKETFLLEAAFYDAFFLRNLERAKEWLDQAWGGAFTPTYLRPMAEAAILLEEGKNEDALEKAREARDLLDDSIDRGSALLAADWLDVLVARASEITDSQPL